MSTSCEYNPVQSTRRNSADFEGRDVVMFGKYFISCVGGSTEGVWNAIVVENAPVCFQGCKAGRGRMHWYGRVIRCRNEIDLVRDRRRGEDMRAQLKKSCMVSKVRIA